MPDPNIVHIAWSDEAEETLCGLNVSMKPVTQVAMESTCADCVQIAIEDLKQQFDILEGE